MRTPIIRSFDPVTLIGGGDLGPDDLSQALARAPVLVAADGGAVAALNAGHRPVAVIGDFDSFPAAAREQIPPERLFNIPEQDSTDFDKALRNIKAPLVLGVGFLGGRVDHQLAALNALVWLADRPCILIGQSEVIFHAPRQMQMDLQAGDTVSLFPLAQVQGRSEGLAWPIDGLVMAPDRRVGTSNRALGPVQLQTEGPGLLVIVPRRALDAVIRAIGPDRAPKTGHVSG